jgi:hypothetical protein
MSIAIRHSFYAEPALPHSFEREAGEPRPSLAATLRELIGAFRSPVSHPTRSAQPTEARPRRTLFHDWAAADLADRDVALPLLRRSFDR